MGYRVGRGGNLLRALAWRVVVNCYGLLCDEWW